MKTWIKSLICLISFLICFFGEILVNVACGPEADPYDYYASFFHNTIQGNSTYRPFYFNGYAFLNDDEKPASEGGINSSEWAAYLGKGTSANDVEKAMYRLSSKVDSVLVLTYLKPNKKLPDSLYKNTFLNVLVSGTKNSGLNYYRFAKGAEPLAAVLLEDRWNPKTPDPKALRDKGYEALKRAGAEKDAFIKLRYYYQAQRMLRYSGDYKVSNKIYDKYIAGSKSRSHVMGWALSLRAGGELAAGNSAKAAYLFSKIFALYSERRIQAFTNFNNINEASANVLKFAKTPGEKAFVYAISGLHNSRVSTKSLEQVYKVYPQSLLLKVLLVREINKIEEQYLSVKLHKTAIYNPYSYYDFVGEDSTAKKQAAYLPTLKAFCQKLAAERKCAEPALGSLAFSYLSWITGDTRDGLKALAAIKNQKLKSNLANQQQLIKLLLLTQKINKQRILNETELVPSLTWLNKMIALETRAFNLTGGKGYNESYDMRQYARSARDFYAQVLAPAYLSRKDTAMAGLVLLKSQLCYSYIDTYSEYHPPRPPGFDIPDFLQRKLHSGHLNNIISWAKAPVKTPYIKQLTTGINKNVYYNLYDLLGTSFLREHKYSRAADAFKKLPPSLSKRTPNDWDKTLHSDPFISHMLDFPKAYTSSVKGYTKLQFAKRMVSLQNKVKADPKKASSYYYIMANGVYNTVMDGNGWYYISYTNTSYDRYREATEYYDGDFLNALYAEKYYLKACSLSKDPEFKAKCTFMAAKCQQKQNLYNLMGIHSKDEDYNILVRQNPYFRELRNNYKTTAFFKRATNECSYLQDFLNARIRVGR
ncbi:hypothetical protein ABIB62_000516 [Mucilaginibacter sp. UYP25]|uniref:hypothetical protein n=1 Tax=unclassified Mucilaginibacter TaxID=2617802 RepID=UPI003394E6C3